jgi:hypothetical protein
MARFKSADQVRKVIQGQLTIGVSTPQDVEAFLNAVGWEHSELIIARPELRIKLPGDSVMYSSLPAPAGLAGWLGLIKAKWLIKFHFTQNKLSNVEIEQGLIGL